MINPNLIMDQENGKFVVRRCEHNFVVLGYWGTWWHFYKSYWKLITGFEYEAVWNMVCTLLMCILFVVLFPVLPFLRAYTSWRRAVQFVRLRAESVAKK